jgi:hypothetical protein
MSYLDQDAEPSDIARTLWRWDEKPASQLQQRSLFEGVSRHVPDQFERIGGK